MTRSLRLQLAALTTLLGLFTAGTTFSATDFSVSNTNDDGPGSLRQAIRDANVDKTATIDTLHTISFDSGISGTINLKSALDTIMNHVAINGPGASVLTLKRDIDSHFTILTIYQNRNVTIAGLTFMNGRAQGSTGNGGAINSTGVVTISDCVFSGNVANNQGGAIYSVWKTTLNNCTFSDNSAGEGAAVANSEIGTLTINGSQFSGNSASIGGGIVNRGTLTVDNSTLTANSSHLRGGAITNYGTLTARICEIADNSSPDGGGIYNNSTGTMIIDSSRFINDTATYGGSIVNAGVLTLSNSNFTGNYAQTGGGIGNSGTISATNCTFTDNVANYSGGAIDCSGGLTLLSCTFTSNKATGGNGGAIQSFAALTATGCIFNYNSSQYGGGIYKKDAGDFKATGCIFTANKATLGGGGMFNYGNFSMEQCEVSANTALEGAGIYTTAVSAVYNSTIAGNAASTNGGGIFTTSTLTISNATIASNSAMNMGGGIYNTGLLTTLNTIVAQDTSAMGVDVFGSIVSRGHNLIGNADNSSGWEDTDQVGATGSPIGPKLGPLQNNGGRTRTMELLDGSPAVNAGDDAVLAAPYNFTTDQRGTARKLGVSVDIGAYESAFIEAGVPNDVSGDNTSAGTIALRLVPNPISRGFRIDYTLSAPTAVTLELYTMEGRRVAIFLNGEERESGAHTEQFEATDLPAGAYTLHLLTQTGRSVQQIVVMQ